MSRRIPGWTAEASCTAARGRYAGGRPLAAPLADGAVIPQLRECVWTCHPVCDDYNRPHHCTMECGYVCGPVYFVASMR